MLNVFLKQLGLATIVGVLGLSVACPDTGGEGEGEGEGETTPRADALIEALIAARETCPRINALLGLGEPGLIERLEPSFDAEAYLRGNLESFRSDELDPLRALNQAAYDTCLADITSCAADVFGEAHACSFIFTGTRTDGQGCENDDDCVSGACIDGDGDCGTCEPAVALGGDCTDKPCAQGLTCDDTETCVEILSSGDACTAASDHCDRGLVCTGAGAAAVCAAEVTFTVGSACVETCGGVLSGLACVEAVCVAINVVGVGEGCDGDGETKDYCVDTASSNVCGNRNEDGRGTCLLLPSSGACIERYTGDDDNQGDCAGQHLCVDDVCVPYPAAGEACQFTCAGELVCDFESNVCVEAAALGESCETRGCAGDLTCAFETEICAVREVRTCEA